MFIHPFIDGNGRISRLLMNAALIQDGYMLAVVPPILEHEYIELLEKAHKDDRTYIRIPNGDYAAASYYVSKIR